MYIAFKVVIVIFGAKVKVNSDHARIDRRFRGSIGPHKIVQPQQKSWSSILGVIFGEPYEQQPQLYFQLGNQLYNHD